MEALDTENEALNPKTGALDPPKVAVGSRNEALHPKHQALD